MVSLFFSLLNINFNFNFEQDLVIMLINYYLLLQLFLITIARADVFIYKPDVNQKYELSKGSSATVQVSWVDTLRKPKLYEITTYTFVLCTGDDNNIQPVATLQKNVPASKFNTKDNTYLAKIYSKQVRKSGLYFLQVVSSGKDFVTIHYTDKFSIILDGDSVIPSHDMTAPPPPAETINSKSKNKSKGKATSTPLSINSDYYTIPYEKQTTLGSVRYAPMQSSPGTKTSKTRWSSKMLTTKNRKKFSKLPVFTKAGGYAKGSKMNPNVEYTITQPPSSTAKTSINTMSHASSRLQAHSAKVKKPFKVNRSDQKKVKVTSS